MRISTYLKLADLGRKNNHRHCRPGRRWDPVKKKCVRVSIKERLQERKKDRIKAKKKKRGTHHMTGLQRISDYLTQAYMADIDAGSVGKRFERNLIKAFELVGLDFDVNRASGSVWDIRAKGPGWRRLVTQKAINIKVTRARWLFGSSEFATMIPWDDVDAFDIEDAQQRVKQTILARGIGKVIFLKPKTEEIQATIERAVQKDDVGALNNLLVKNNFRWSKLGTQFDVRISTRDGRIGSIAIVKDGKVWGRSERPRTLGHSHAFVGFRKPKNSLGKGLTTSLRRT